MAPNFEMAPLDRWIFASGFDPVRARRLSHPPNAETLIASVIEEAERAATVGQIELSWDPCGNRPGFGRLLAVIPMCVATFDQVFNGRSGYRAQYYRGPKHGELFNEMIVRGLVNAVSIAYAVRARTIPLPTYLQSLAGQWSKIAVFGDKDPYLDSSASLRVPEWVEYWANDDCELGLRVPLPDQPRLDLKGTFINPDSGEAWVADRKRRRSEGLHLCGWDSARDLD